MNDGTLAGQSGLGKEPIHEYLDIGQRCADGRQFARECQLRPGLTRVGHCALSRALIGNESTPMALSRDLNI